MESRASPNSWKVTPKSGKFWQNHVISTSLTSKESEQSSENKKRNKFGKPRKDASIAGLTGRLLEMPDNEEEMWPTKAKSHFNLRRIFSKSQIADERSNSARSIETDSDHAANGQQILNHKSSSLKKCLSRKLSFAFSTKLLGKNLSRINSASTVNKSDVTGKRVCPTRHCRDQSQSSLADTDSDEQRVNRAKTIRFSAIDLPDEFDQADGQTDNESGTEPFWFWPSTDNVQVPIKDSVPTIDRLGSSARVDQAAKINRQQELPLTSKSGSSVAIITRYSNYAECLDEAVELLSKKGINCKTEK